MRTRDGQVFPPETRSIPNASTVPSGDTTGPLKDATFFVPEPPSWMTQLYCPVSGSNETIPRAPVFLDVATLKSRSSVGEQCVAVKSMPLTVGLLTSVL